MQRPLRFLELFAGAGSIGRAFEQQGWEVASLDINPNFGPTRVADILSWDYRVYKPDHFHYVWASPVCTEYSIARTTGPTRNLLSADKLAQRALLIMTYFGCNWAFENPQSGLLKTRDIVKGIPFADTSFCRYGYAYGKKTDLDKSSTVSASTMHTQRPMLRDGGEEASQNCSTIETRY